jgi:hypothetical protein
MPPTNATRPAPALAGSEPRKSDRHGGSIFPRDKVPESETQEPNGNGAYVASDIKRFRRSKADMVSIRDAIFELLTGDNPQSVRQVFYALTVRGVIKKAEVEYQRTVIRLLTEMREAGTIPFHYIADNTRWMRKPTTFTGLDSCLERTSNFYRRDLWETMPVYVEVARQRRMLR